MADPTPPAPTTTTPPAPTDAAARRPRVLVIAESCNPEWVSVPLLGWSHAHALRAVADVHLVTQVRNRLAVRKAGLVEGRDFTAIDTEHLARPLLRVANALRGGRVAGWTIRTATDWFVYRHFEQLIWERFGADVRRGRFDVVHRLTSLSPTHVSPIAARCRSAGVPFVWGPVNGGVPWPRAFDAARRAEREWLSYVRGAHRLLPGYVGTRGNSAAIMIASRATWAQMPASYRARCVYVPENGVDPARFHLARRGPARRPLRAVFVGRLVPYKGADMLLDAAAPLVRAGDLAVDILGDGPQRAALEAQAKSVGSPAVRVLGRIPHTDLQHHLAAADVLAFPSIREFGGAVVLEAMAVGVVPVVVDYGGPAELVTDATGIRIPLGTRAEIVERLRTALAGLVADPARVDAMSPLARRRALDLFSWPAKARQTRAVYDWVLGRGPKPVFAIPMPDLPPRPR